MHPTFEQTASIARFACLGADCPDTCCRGWDMPADSQQRERYAARAPELLEILDTKENILRRNPEGQHCAQLCDGMCSVHAKYGTDFLGDACYFYPRLVHNIGGTLRMSGAISCPEMLRLIMQSPDPFAVAPAQPERLPVHRRDIVPNGWDRDSVLAVMDAALACAQDETLSPEAIVARLLALAEAMEESTPHDWQQRWRLADANAPAALSKEGDSHTVYYALALTEAFGQPGISQKLAGIMQAMEEALFCRFDRPTRNMAFLDGSLGVAMRLKQRWHIDAARALAPALRRWIGAQLVMTAFPFGGFHAIGYAARGAVLVQRFATMRLALMCHVPMRGETPDEATVSDVMQGLSRFIDHLADAKLTMMIHRDAGWNTPARLRGLIA